MRPIPKRPLTLGNSVNINHADYSSLKVNGKTVYLSADPPFALVIGKPRPHLLLMGGNDRRYSDPVRFRTNFALARCARRRPADPDNRRPERTASRMSPTGSPTCCWTFPPARGAYYLREPAVRSGNSTKVAEARCEQIRYRKCANCQVSPSCQTSFRSMP